MLDLATKALRERSPGVLRSGLATLVQQNQAQGPEDLRDLMVALAPFYDCSCRLGLDVTAVFDDAAEAAPGAVAQLIRDFGRRTDVTPEAFGFFVEDTPAGAVYRWA